MVTVCLTIPSGEMLKKEKKTLIISEKNSLDEREF